MAAARELEVVTLNVWGLPDFPFRKLSPHRSERIEAIREELFRQSAHPEGLDVVLLQEAWLRRDRELLKNSGYPYSVDLEDRLKPLDSGLLILSRHPVVGGSSARLKYSEGGFLRKGFSDGEFFAS